jgi:hypothetical protein
MYDATHHFPHAHYTHGSQFILADLSLCRPIFFPLHHRLCFSQARVLKKWEGGARGLYWTYGKPPCGNKFSTSAASCAIFVCNNLSLL